MRAYLIVAIALATAVSEAALFDLHADKTLYVEGKFAPVGTPIWFVSDTTLLGIPASGNLVSYELIQSIAAGDGPIALQYVDAVNGDLPGKQPGRYRHTSVSFSDELTANGDMLVLLWNDRNRNGFGGDPGDTFDYVNLGIPRMPEGGDLRGGPIDIPRLNADAFTVSAIPEPRHYALLAGGALLMWGAARRRNWR